jgi:hypothetical protein
MHREMSPRLKKNALGDEPDVKKNALGEDPGVKMNALGNEPFANNVLQKVQVDRVSLIRYQILILKKRSYGWFFARNGLLFNIKTHLPTKTLRT